MKILIIEDETELSKSIAAYLEVENYTCEFASTVQEALYKTEVFEYDCILLDIGLPDGSGMKVLEELKKDNKQDGVIIISAKNELDDKIRGLKIGADDYLTKPFHLPELSARIFSVVRRRRFDNSNKISQNELEIDILGKTITVNDIPVSLTKKEFDLLIYFVGNKNRIISKNTLAEHLSGDDLEFDNYDLVYAHVKNLKKKLSEAGCRPYLKTVYGSGYKWEIK